MGEFLDLIEEKGRWFVTALLVAAVLVAGSLLSGQTLGIAAADSGISSQQCVSTCADAPRLGDFVNQDSQRLFGLTQDHGRVTFMFYWTGTERPAVVQLGHVVQGEWVPYVVSVKFDQSPWPFQNQVLAYVVNGKPQLVTMTTSGVQPGDYVEARAYWCAQFFTGQRDQFYPLAGADAINIAA